MAICSGPAIATSPDIVRVFTTSGVFTPSFTGTVEVLVVGGGGAGGGGIGGGGGGGGVVYMPTVSVTSGTAYTITVGAGGAAIVYSSISGSGGDSTAFGATAKGGGGSGVHDSGDGVTGGSGGGAASNNGRLNTGGTSSGNSLGSNTGTIYGNRGGNMTTARVGGPTAAAGGGGAGAAAADTNSNNVQTSPGNANGRGGAGIASSILGTQYFWAGGGGGGAYFNGYAGDGGIGGGGGGSCSAGAGPSRGGGNGLNSGIGAAIDTNGAPGATNTGGGGGGGAWQVTSGGAGGSGIVVIRYNSSLGASTGGAPASVGNMALCLDASNPNSNVGNRSIINWNNWTTGSGGVAGYSQNGATAENERVIATNPWGNNAVVWEARPLAETNDDGGWNTTDFAIDNTQLYRFSVWVRRTSSTSGGTFYLGTGSNGGVRKMSDSTAADNPYWECSNTGILAQNTWYLFVGHIYPANTTFTGRNPDTGYYTVNGRAGNINGCNIGTGDLKWNSNSTTAIHRTYLYYCPDNTTRLQFYQPRVDLCNGTEPSIQELLSNAGNTWYDLSGNNNNCTFLDLPSTNTGFYTFNGTSNYGTVINNSTLNFASAQTLQFVMRHSFTTGRRNPWDQAYGGYGTWTHETGDNITQFYGNSGANADPYVGITSATTPRSVWNVLCAVRSTTQFKWYLNGVLSGTTSNPYGVLANTAANITIGNGYAGFWQGDMAMVTAYTRALSDSEVAQNFNAIRGRFGL